MNTNTCAHESATSYNGTFYCDSCNEATGTVLLPCPRTGEVTAGCTIPTGETWGNIALTEKCSACDGMGSVRAHYAETRDVCAGDTVLTHTGRVVRVLWVRLNMSRATVRVWSREAGEYNILTASAAKWTVLA